MKHDYTMYPEYTVVYIKRKDGMIVSFMIDNDDFDKVLLIDYSWMAKWDRTVNNYYIRSNMCVAGKQKYFYLHRWIMNAPKDMQVDHINHNPLDNRKSNLRIVTNQQNSENRSGPYITSALGVRGVYPHGDKYRAHVQIAGKPNYLGTFDTLESAEKAVTSFRKENMKYSTT